ncbi:hypothetical protein BLOT_009562, partial [Blomia tropicalis]
ESYEEGGFTVGTFPKTYDYPEEENGLHEMNDADKIFSNEVKPKIIIMGLRRSGKSSIQKVVFHKMSPNETLFLESTNKIVKEDISNNSFVSFTIWDFPGQIDIFEREFDFDPVFKGCGALVFVIDSQDDYQEALHNLIHTIRKAHSINSNINFEVFIHKVDGLSDDHKIEARQEIHHRAHEDLAELDESVMLSFYLTSIYDRSIFEAFSKVVQKLIPQLPILENLLNIFISSSGIEKAFLFDVVSKIFIATDSSPVDMQSYELCCEMIDLVIDISCIYGINENGEGTTFDDCSSSSISLNSGTVLYLRQVNKFLALVCILREENFTKQGMIDYNFQMFRKSIQDVFIHRLSDTTRASNTNIDTPYGSSNAPDGEDSHNGTVQTTGEDMYPSPFSNELIDPSKNGPTYGHVRNNVYKPTTSPQAVTVNQQQTRRKTAIIPTTSTVSSLPSHSSGNIGQQWPYQ